MSQGTRDLGGALFYSAPDPRIAERTAEPDFIKRGVAFQAAALGRAKELDVLVLDAEYRQALAALRSLGSAGFRVGAVVCASEAHDSLATRSRWCVWHDVVPDFAANPRAYVDAILSLLDRQPARVLLPSHDGTIAALRQRRPEIEARTALALASDQALDIAVSKPRTLALAQKLGIAVPRSIGIRDASDARAAMRDLGFPAVIKPAESWAQQAGTGTRQSVEAVRTEYALLRRLETIQAQGGQAIVQEWLPGTRDAVSLFYANGRVWARFVQTSRRELPAVGGASVFCESIAPSPDLIEPAEALVRAMNLEGCSMIEFRRDRRGRPTLMEVNARLAGSAALAHAAGVDFPALLRSWALRDPLRAIPTYKTGVRLRWLAGDLGNLQTAVRHGGVDVPPRHRALATFFGDFLLSPSPLDVFDRRDLRPALHEVRRTLRVFTGAVGRSARRLTSESARGGE
jgi:predicted ATP-grasp superfamily ATP-dependent carboligase